MKLSNIAVTPTEAIVLPLVSLVPVDDSSADFDGDVIGLFDSPDEDFSYGGDFAFANNVDEPSPSGARSKNIGAYIIGEFRRRDSVSGETGEIIEL